jgi:regulator of cell morphogenesis and NO signaling
MEKEEQVLFPYIHRLELLGNEHRDAPRPHFGSVANPISMMEDEHEAVGELLGEIRKLSGDYTPPPDSCNTFKALYAGLKDFESDLFLHIHLENNILFPKSEALEKQIYQE